MEENVELFQLVPPRRVTGTEGTKKVKIRKITPSLGIQNGKEIDRIESEHPTTKDKTTVVISDLGREVDVLNRKRGGFHMVASFSKSDHGPRVPEEVFHVGNEVDIHSGSCGTTTRFGTTTMYPFNIPVRVVTIYPNLHVPFDFGLSEEQSLACAFTFNKKEKKNNGLTDVECFNKLCLDKARHAYENSGTVRIEIINKETGKKKIHSVVKEHVNFLPNDVIEKIGKEP